MKTNSVSGQFRNLYSLGGWNRLFWLCLTLAGVALWPAGAAQLKEARVSQVIKDVNLLPNQAAPRPAKVSDQVRDGTAVRTGTESRAELTFTDQTLARLGANTIFSFNQGTRNLELGGGAMLLRVPKNAGGAQIHTAAVTAAITGTTIMMEYHPNAYIKFIVLEGTGRIFRTDHVGESVLLHAGQMLIVNPKAKGLPDPVDVDVDRLMKTSLLITDFGPIPSSDLIAREIQTQVAQKNEGGLVETNLVIFGGGTAVSLLDPTHASVVDQANSNEERQAMLSPSATPSPSASPSPTITPTPTPSPTVSPTPSKFGTPPVISSQVPYVIGSGTTIQTDPSITTNGVTDFGKIYRGPTDDGPVSAWLFGSTSSFDTERGVDTIFSDPTYLPLAALKFLALTLTGNPTISIANGGATNLALVSVGDITSGPPGGTLTFSGLNLLVLATQDGSITLTSDLAFQDIPTLGVYARGTNSTLTFDSSISGSSIVALVSEGDFQATNSLTINETSNANAPNGLIISILAGQSINIGQDLTLSITNSDLISTDALIGVVSDGDTTVNGDLNLTLDNNATELAGSASLSVAAGGNFTASSISLLLNNFDGGSIDDDAAMSLSAAGAVTTTGDANLIIDNADTGGTIGTTASLSLNGAQLSVGGNLEVLIANNNGGSILGSTGLVVSSSGNLTTTGETDLILDDSAFGAAGFNLGGNISSDAAITLLAANVTTGGGLFTFLFNDGGGHITGNATINSALTGNMATGSDLFFDVQNSADTDNNGALLPGGTIDGNGSVTVAVEGNITSQGAAEFAVLNNDFRSLTGGGSIDAGATVILTANSLTTATYFQPLVNNRYGTIGDGASVNVAVTGDVSIGTDTFFNILDTNGSIGGSAISTLSAANFSSGSTFQFQILNDTGSIGDSALLTASLTGGLTSIGESFVQITNEGGLIGQDATIDVSAASFSASSLLLQIDNLGGTIGGDATIDMNVSGNATTTGDATLQILGSDAAATAAIDISGGNYDAGGTFLTLIDGDGAITFTNATAHADVLKVGALGTNGVLTIGGGTLSADTTLKLYASGSNGQLNFVSNVTLDGAGTKTLAANTITISNNVVVTVGGTIPADVYTGFNGEIPNANYTGSGGNGSTTGTFAGAGANAPQPLANAPPFDGASSAATTVTNGSVTSGGNITDRKRTGTLVDVSSTDQLLNLLDAAAPGAGGKIVIPASKSTSNSRNFGRTNAAGRVSANRGAAGFRGAARLAARPPL